MEFVLKNSLFVCLFVLRKVMLLWSCFSRVQLCANPEMAAHQALPSLEFSRQEHWSGLPFPSPKHESEKWKWSRSVVSDSSQPHGLQPTRLFHPWDFPGKSTGVGCHCLLHFLTLKSCMFRIPASPQVQAVTISPLESYRSFWPGLSTLSPSH